MVSDLPPEWFSGLNLAEVTGRGLPPIETWDPPYCGDIGLEIRADGSWWHQGQAFNRPGLSQMLSKLMRREADGRFMLVSPQEKVLIRVAFCPFMVVDMVKTEGVQGSEIVATTNMGDHVTLGLDHTLAFWPRPGASDLAPVVHIRAGLWALVSRPVYYHLMSWATEAPVSEHQPLATARWSVVSGGTVFAIPTGDQALVVDG